jgi:hypothetical protein
VGLQKIKMSFVTAVLCAEGKIAGEWLGDVRWSATIDLSTFQTTVDHGPPTRSDDPGSELTNALNLWGGRHGWSMPEPTEPEEVRRCP